MRLTLPLWKWGVIFKSWVVSSLTVFMIKWRNIKENEKWGREFIEGIEVFLNNVGQDLVRPMGSKSGGKHSCFWWEYVHLLVLILRDSKCENWEKQVFWIKKPKKPEQMRNTGREVNFRLCMLGLRIQIKAENLKRLMILSSCVAAKHLQNKLSLLCFGQDGCLMLKENRILKWWGLWSDPIPSSVCLENPD